MTKNDIIKELSLEKHIEGGYFTRTYCSDISINTDRTSQQRPLCTSIYYMFTNEKPIGYFTRNKSTIVHYFHAGSPLNYLVIHPDGRLEKVILGADVTQGHKPQLVVKAGCWKATRLKQGEFGLLSEAVSPGFDYNDMEIAKADVLRSNFSHLWDEIKFYVKP